MHSKQINYSRYELEIHQRLSRFNNWIQETSDKYNQMFQMIIDIVNSIYNDSSEVLRNSGNLQAKQFDEIFHLLARINTIEFNYNQFEILKNKYSEIVDQIRQHIMGFTPSIDRIFQLKNELQRLNTQVPRLGVTPQYQPYQQMQRPTVPTSPMSIPLTSSERSETIHTKQAISTENKSSEKGKQEDKDQNAIRELLLTQRLDGLLDKYEMKQLEYWTQKRMVEIVFDSSEQQWSEHRNDFPSYVCFKRDLVFVIEDIEGNKFGGYISSIIKDRGNTIDSIVTDEKAFLFSLKSNGRINGMRKFDIKVPDNACIVFDDQSQAIIKFGNDICLMKEEHKEKSWVKQQTYAYGEFSTVLIGRRYPYNCFTPRRFVVIQMT